MTAFNEQLLSLVSSPPLMADIAAVPAGLAGIAGGGRYPGVVPHLLLLRGGEGSSSSSGSVVAVLLLLLGCVPLMVWAVVWFGRLGSSWQGRPVEGGTTPARQRRCRVNDHDQRSVGHPTS